MTSTISSGIWKQIRTGDRIQVKTTIEIQDDNGIRRRSVTAGKQYPVAVYAPQSGLVVRIVDDDGITAPSWRPNASRLLACKGDGYGNEEHTT